MDITAIQQNEVTIVLVKGSLDALTAQGASDFLGQELQTGHTHLVVDLSGVDYLSSAGLRALLAAMQQARNVGGDLRLAGAQPNVGKVLDLAGFTKIMKSYPASEQAVASFVAWGACHNQLCLSRPGSPYGGNPSDPGV